MRDHYKTVATLDVPLQDLIDRMLFAEAIETQKCFDEGVLTTTADATSARSSVSDSRPGPVVSRSTSSDTRAVRKVS